jgi:hypothetical protein
MKRQSILSITAAAALALALLPGRAVSQTGIVLITARSPACQSILPPLRCVALV